MSIFAECGESSGSRITWDIGISRRGRAHFLWTQKSGFWAILSDSFSSPRFASSAPAVNIQPDVSGGWDWHTKQVRPADGFCAIIWLLKHNPSAQGEVSTYRVLAPLWEIPEGPQSESFSHCPWWHSSSMSNDNNFSSIKFLLSVCDNSVKQIWVRHLQPLKLLNFFSVSDFSFLSVK